MIGANGGRVPLAHAPPPIFVPQPKVTVTPGGESAWTDYSLTAPPTATQGVAIGVTTSFLVARLSAFIGASGVWLEAWGRLSFTSGGTPGSDIILDWSALLGAVSCSVWQSQYAGTSLGPATFTWLIGIPATSTTEVVDVTGASVGASYTISAVDSIEFRIEGAVG